MIRNRFITLVLVGTLVLSTITGCGKSGGQNTTGKDENIATGQEPTEHITTGEIGVSENEEFGSIYIEPSIDEFNEMGFKYGDSLDITFDNGTVLEDVPYFSGYYASIGELLLCAYPGYPHAVIARSFGGSTWDEFGLKDNSKVTITLRERGRYSEYEELFALKYSDDYDDYDTDAEFGNFREIKGGKLKKGMFYRSASPCDNSHKRAVCVNSLIEEKKVKFVINLSDNEERYKEHEEDPDFMSFYYDNLYRDGNVMLLGLDANYKSEEYAKSVSEALLAMTEHGEPVLIHCVEGKDRTGFVSALLLALAGASKDEITDDYMITFDNYYGITKDAEPEKYKAIKVNVNDFLYCLCDAEKGVAVNTLDIKKGAENYLRRGGLSDEDIKAIEKYITEQE